VIILNGRPATIAGDFRLDRADQGRDPAGIARLVATILDAQDEVLP